jgi:UDP-2,3-diacylglucosamine hydrolase
MRRAPWPHAVTPIPAEGELLFVADPHFTEGGSGPLADFCAFARAHRGETLVLLGDVFHLFQGPEILREPRWRDMLACLRACAHEGRVVFLPGNRDFQAGRALARAAGVLLPGETARFLSGGRCVYACRGDQLCQDDVLYQRMKRVIRNPLVVGAWSQLPSSVRTGIARALRAFTLRSLRKKTARQLVASPDVVRRLFAQGADIVVSGHRHVGARTAYDVGGRACEHHELPPWCDERTFLRVRAGAAETAHFGA